MRRFVNIIMAKFDELSKLAGMPITHEDMVQFVEVWCAFDAHAEGTVPLAQLPELLAMLPKEIGYNELADEDAIEPTELRLPLRPGPPGASRMPSRFP